MHLADIAVCREHTQGVVTAGDYHAAFQRDRPQMDFVQDWRTVASGREAQTFPAGKNNHAIPPPTHHLIPPRPRSRPPRPLLR